LLLNVEDGVHISLSNTDCCDTGYNKLKFDDNLIFNSLTILKMSRSQFVPRLVRMSVSKRPFADIPNILGIIDKSLTKPTPLRITVFSGCYKSRFTNDDNLSNCLDQLRLTELYEYVPRGFDQIDVVESFTFCLRGANYLRQLSLSYVNLLSIMTTFSPDNNIYPNLNNFFLIFSKQGDPETCFSLKNLRTFTRFSQMMQNLQVITLDFSHVSLRRFTNIEKFLSLPSLQSVSLNFLSTCKLDNTEQDLNTLRKLILSGTLSNLISLKVAGTYGNSANDDQLALFLCGQEISFWCPKLSKLDVDLSRVATNKVLQHCALKNLIIRDYDLRPIYDYDILENLLEMVDATNVSCNVTVFATNCQISTETLETVKSASEKLSLENRNSQTTIDALDRLQSQIEELEIGGSSGNLAKRSRCNFNGCIKWMKNDSTREISLS
jgi:hypothetical protein